MTGVTIRRVEERDIAALARMVSALAAQLTGGQRFGAFTTAAACMIQRTAGRAEVEFMLDPKHLG